MGLGIIIGLFIGVAIMNFLGSQDEAEIYAKAHETAQENFKRNLKTFTTKTQYGYFIDGKKFYRNK